jgi:hypothetical protein
VRVYREGRVTGRFRFRDLQDTPSMPVPWEPRNGRPRQLTKTEIARLDLTPPRVSKVGLPNRFVKALPKPCGQKPTPISGFERGITNSPNPPQSRRSVDYDALRIATRGASLVTGSTGPGAPNAECRLTRTTSLSPETDRTRIATTPASWQTWSVWWRPDRGQPSRVPGRTNLARWRAEEIAEEMRRCMSLAEAREGTYLAGEWGVR